MELSTGQALSEETRSRAVEALHALVLADRIDNAQFERTVAELLETRTEAELAELLRSLPPASPMTPAERRRDGPLKLGGGFGRLRIEGRWQLARQTSISVELGSVTIDLGDAELDDRIVDLKVYTGCGAIKIIVPPGLGIEVVRHRGRVISRIGPPTPGLPLVRLTALTTSVAPTSSRQGPHLPGSSPSGFKVKPFKHRKPAVRVVERPQSLEVPALIRIEEAAQEILDLRTGHLAPVLEPLERSSSSR